MNENGNKMIGKSVTQQLEILWACGMIVTNYII
jgi:hypothetical protein